jgi:SAM-dependent methyltransferase
VATGDREQLRTTFDSAAALYQQARPEYPAELYDELIRLTGIGGGDRLLEVGCATGKATLPLARRGLPITCLELGADLAAAARRHLAAFPAVQVVTANFETWRPQPPATFDLVFAATAWHWIDPAAGYPQAWKLLRPDGGDSFFADIQEVYDEIGEGMPAGTLCDRPGEVPDSRADIEASGLFGDVAVRQFDWSVSYDADSYLRLLDTFSGHIAMAEWQRRRLYGEIRRRLGQRPDGRLRRHWGAVLHVARRLDASR